LTKETMQKKRSVTAMQRMELSLVTALYARQRSLIPDGQPVVAELTVTTMKEGLEAASLMG